MMTFAEAVAEIAAASHREILYTQISIEDYTAGMEAQQVAPDVIQLVTYLFTTVLDGRNSCLTDGVQRALGHQPRDFSDYVRNTAATGIWNG